MSKFEQGQPKPPGSGRKRGVRNKKSQILSDVLEDIGVHLPTKIFELLPSLSPEKQADILLGLMSFMYPKLKAVEYKEVLPPQPPQPFIVQFVKSKNSVR